MTKSKRNRQSNRSLRYRDQRAVPAPPSVLIVTEGKVIETEYFRLVAKEFGIDGDRVTIVPGKGTSPMNVVTHAQWRLKRDEQYDYVYCVFDRDTHGSYDEAVSLVQRMAKDNGATKKIEAITSVPCFEYWCFLHVRDSAASYSGVDSPCDKLTKEMKNHPPFEDYKKSKEWMSTNFTALAANRDEAVKRAKRVLSHAKKVGSKAHSEDPSTRVHIVVERLKKIGEVGRG